MMVEFWLFLDIVKQFLSFGVEFVFVAIDVEPSEFDGETGSGSVFLFIVDSLRLSCQQQLTDHDGYA